MTRSADPKGTVSGLWLARMAIAASGLAFVGCVTPGDGGSGALGLGGGGQVVERSRPEAPAWTTLAVGRIHETETTLQFVELGARLRDLPLGLKQTQLGALEASRKALSVVVKDRLESDRSTLTAYGIQEFDRTLDEVATSLHERSAKVTDIYFERVENAAGQDLTEFFNAYVLVTIPRDQMASAMAGFATRLAGSSDLGVRQLGERLKADVAPSAEVLPAADFEPAP